MKLTRRLSTLLSITAFSLIPHLVIIQALAQEDTQPTPTSPINSGETSTGTTNQGRKLRVAVLDFDYSSVSDPSFLQLFDGQSRGVSDILVNRLVMTGNFSVIERSKIEAVLAEQNLGASGRVDPSTAAEIGRILGVDVIILGSITQFDVQQRSSGGGFGPIAVNTQKTEAYVKLNTRVVSTTTGEILAIGEGNGEESQSDTQVRVVISGGTMTENTQKLLTLATEEAIDQVIAQISGQQEQMAAAAGTGAVTALIAYVDGGTVILNKGSSDGYSVGMKLSIERVIQEIKDPQTGETLRQLTEKIAEIEITEVDGNSSVARILTPGPQLNVGDVAKPIQ